MLTREWTGGNPASMQAACEKCTQRERVNRIARQPGAYPIRRVNRQHRPKGDVVNAHPAASAAGVGMVQAFSGAQEQQHVRSGSEPPATGHKLSDRWPVAPCGDRPPCHIDHRWVAEERRFSPHMGCGYRSTHTDRRRWRTSNDAILMERTAGIDHDSLARHGFGAAHRDHHVGAVVLVGRLSQQRTGRVACDHLGQ